MTPLKEVWVLPEIFPDRDGITNLSAGLLSEARYIADKIGAVATALLFGGQSQDYQPVLSQYGIDKAYFFQHPLLKQYSAEGYISALKDTLKAENPWMLILGQTTIGQELAPALAAFVRTGVVSGCVKIDFSNLQKPLFYRPVFHDQAYQEIAFRAPGTLIVTLDTGILNVTPVKNRKESQIVILEPSLSDEDFRVKHLGYLPADYKTMDITEADVVIGTGMGVLSAGVFPLVEELSALIEGSIGSTRPVIDEGKLSRERLIGQTGKIISPQLYLALGVSGATHHLGGIQDSKTIVAINRDTQAPIFQNTDVGLVADLKMVLPELIEKIKYARKDGQIL